MEKSSGETADSFLLPVHRRHNNSSYRIRLFLLLLLLQLLLQLLLLLLLLVFESSLLSSSLGFIEAMEFRTERARDWRSIRTEETDPTTCVTVPYDT